MLDKKAYTEVYYILSNMSDEMRDRVPKKIVRNIKKRMDKNYDFKIDDFGNVKLLDDTEKILAVLYNDYWLDYEEYREELQDESLEYENVEKFPTSDETQLVVNKELTKFQKVVLFLDKLFFEE